MVEFELRTSDLHTLYQANHLDHALVNVGFSKDNLMDLLISRDLTDNASFELSIVSTDRRSLRQNRKFYLNEIDFETPYSFKLYSIQDAIQVRVKDIQDVFASFNVAELPLSIDRSVLQFVQTGGKQLQV